MTQEKEFKEVDFYSKEIGRNLTLSTGQYTNMDENDEDLFYVAITDDDDLCYQYDGLTLELVNQVFDELKPQIFEDDFYGKIYPETCELYGFVYN